MGRNGQATLPRGPAAVAFFGVIGEAPGVSDYLPIVLVDGELMARDAATARLVDPEVLSADGLFETMRVEPPQLRAFDEHFARLAASAHALGFPVPDRDRLRAWADALVLAHTLPPNQPLALRLTLTQQRTWLALRPLVRGRHYGPDLGLELHRLPGQRLLPRHKTLAWLPAHRLHPAGREPRFEGVWLDGDVVLEGHTTSLFAVIAGVVRTAPLTLPILPGIGRRAALAHLAVLGLPTHESAFTWSELVHADEAYATSATLGVTPIIAIEGRPKNEGPVTRALRQSLADCGASAE